MAFNVFKSKRDAKIVPSIPVEEELRRRRKENPRRAGESEEQFEMKVMRLHMLFKLYGGKATRELSSFDMLKEKGALGDINTYPPDSTLISYLTSGSGWSIPIHVSDQMYHLVLLLRTRETRGSISNSIQTLLRQLRLRFQKIIFYDGLCLKISYDSRILISSF